MVLDEDALHDVSRRKTDPMTRVRAAYEHLTRATTSSSAQGLGEIWQGRFLRASGADVVAKLDLRTLLIAKSAGARLLDDVLYVKEVLKNRLLGVMFDMVPSRAWSWCASSMCRYPPTPA